MYWKFSKIIILISEFYYMAYFFVSSTLSRQLTIFTLYFAYLASEAIEEKPPKVKKPKEPPKPLPLNNEFADEYTKVNGTEMLFQYTLLLVTNIKMQT